jgi:hypothetical protein
MSRFLKVLAEGIAWGFAMALGWIAAFALMGVAAA